MNLTKLFEMQRVLDERIVKEKGLEGQDLLPQKILALQVELGECANEWRGFKYWSNRQTPTEPDYNWKPNDDGSNLEWKPEYGYKSHPLLEEYIDCLHFILSIGLVDDLYENLSIDLVSLKTDSITKSFIRIFNQIGQLECDFDAYEYQNLIEYFLGLGEMLGFTWEQIEAAYMSKNETNHKRQDTGY
ncbi:dUTP diphosphatase [Paenibacillus vini]|uniref:dUTP diphosphatase n=1 Tax=Paenibacillus vini TaxID=1476024 RepID=UPI0025B6967D|nr:dUTP diphosphatase [Paenibacillus vini]MDN4069967.1 dUTP diphosphatase [Paenibacillus vini]